MSDSQHENPEKQERNSSAFAGLSAEKLAFLTQMTGQMQGKSATDILSLLSGANDAAARQQMSFSDTETELILNALLPGMSEEEKKKIEMMRNLSRIISMRNQNRRGK